MLEFCIYMIQVFFVSNGPFPVYLLIRYVFLPQGLQRSGLLDILMLAEPECETNYRDMIQEHKNAYLQRFDSKNLF